MLISLFTLRIDELLKADIRWNIIHRSFSSPKNSKIMDFYFSSKEGSDQIDTVITKVISFIESCPRIGCSFGKHFFYKILLVQG